MTFDEARKEIDKVLDLLDSDYISNRIDRIFGNLQEEYAPTVEVTKDKAESLKNMVKLVGDEFTQDELPEDGSVMLTDKMFEPQDDFILLKDLNLILHPDSIRVVND